MDSKSPIEAVLSKIFGQPVVLSSKDGPNVLEIDVDFYMGAALLHSQPENDEKNIDRQRDSNPSDISHKIFKEEGQFPEENHEYKTGLASTDISKIPEVDSTLQISLKIRKEVITVLKVKGSDSVENLRHHIKDKLGISPDLHNIYFSGIELKDGRQLFTYNIPNEAVLNLILKTEDKSFGIYVKLLDGRNLVIKVKPLDTIKSLYSII